MLDKTMIEKELYDLNYLRTKIIDELDKLRKTVPENMKLRAANHRNSYQYFLREAGSTLSGKYIKKKDISVAKRLAQIEYYEKLLKNINKEIEAIEKINKCLQENIFIDALNSLSLAKRNLVNPLFVSDNDYISMWLKQEYKGLDFKDNSVEYFTEKGLRVRSKSEVIIASILDEMNIPYLYEKPLTINSVTFHPDFTLLNIKERKEVYWEHFGMMDDADYRNSAFSKIRKYEESGLYLCDSLIWTFETGKHLLNTKEIRKMIMRLKEKLGYC